jgi:hypothetical protein
VGNKDPISLFDEFNYPLQALTGIGELLMNISFFKLVADCITAKSNDNGFGIGH